jgi:hypothetical protein
MRSVSTGTGLCVLGMSILATTLVSSPHVVASALAMAARSPGIQEDGGNGAIRKLACAGPTETWLDPQPRLFERGECAVGVGPGNMSYADVNRDGSPEYFWFDDSGGAGFRFIVERQFNSGMDVLRKYFEVTPAGSKISYAPVLELGEDVATRLLMLRPGIEFLRVIYNQHGWADCDGDGDLDLVITVSASGVGVADLSAIWFENTGMPASQTNPYDLDRDGHVNTADLSLLLMEFTD